MGGSLKAAKNQFRPMVVDPCATVGVIRAKETIIFGEPGLASKRFGYFKT
jgi:hypothetical protein